MAVQSTNWGPVTDSIYDLSTDDYDGTGLAATAADITYDGYFSRLKSSDWTKGSPSSTNWTSGSLNSTNWTKG